MALFTKTILVATVLLVLMVRDGSMFWMGETEDVMRDVEAILPMWTYVMKVPLNNTACIYDTMRQKFKDLLPMDTYVFNNTLNQEYVDMPDVQHVTVKDNNEVGWTTYVLAVYNETVALVKVILYPENVPACNQRRRILGPINIPNNTYTRLIWTPQDSMLSQICYSTSRFSSSCCELPLCMLTKPFIWKQSSLITNWAFTDEFINGNNNSLILDVVTYETYCYGKQTTRLIIQYQNDSFTAPSILPQNTMRDFNVYLTPLGLSGSTCLQKVIDENTDLAYVSEGEVHSHWTNKTYESATVFFSSVTERSTAPEQTRRINVHVANAGLVCLWKINSMYIVVLPQKTTCLEINRPYIVTSVFEPHVFKIEHSQRVNLPANFTVSLLCRHERWQVDFRIRNLTNFASRCVRQRYINKQYIHQSDDCDAEHPSLTQLQYDLDYRGEDLEVKCSEDVNVKPKIWLNATQRPINISGIILNPRVALSNPPQININHNITAHLPEIVDYVKQNFGDELLQSHHHTHSVHPAVYSVLASGIMAVLAVTLYAIRQRITFLYKGISGICSQRLGFAH